jgi:hypothetical protein
VAKKPGHRGDYEVRRKAIRAGRAGVNPVEPVVLPRVFCTDPTGAIGTRLSLRPLLARRVRSDADLGLLMSRERGRMSTRCLTGRNENHCDPLPKFDVADATTRHLTSRGSNGIFCRPALTPTTPGRPVDTGPS